MKSRDVYQTEIRSRDLNRSMPFYRSVFDWPMVPASEDCALVATGEMPMVSIVRMLPIGVATNLLVDNVEQAAAQAVALGGRITCPKSEIPGAGAFIGTVDPFGNELFFWQKYIAADPKPRGSGKNTISYLEITVPDLLAGTKYYAELTGWSFGSIVFRDAFAMARGYGLKRGIGLAEGPASIVAYVEADLAETSEKVEAAGGKIVVPPQPFPGEGESMIFQDLDGIRMGAIQGERT